jgi:hypothetical protein
MKKIAVVLLLMSLYLVCPAPGQAAYLIQLKNGTEFVTSYYWLEGNQVMFYTYGGVLGVNKDFISKIEKSDKTVKLEATAQKVFEDKIQAEMTDKDKEPKKESAPAKVTRDNDPILTEFNALKEKFKGIDKMLTNELFKFSEELSTFRKKILATGNAKPYIQEFTEATDMGNATEAALKSTGQ